MPGATSISLLWNGGSPTVGSDGVDSNGTYIVAATIPSNAALGANTVVARGNTGATATCSLNVVSAATPTSTSGTSGTSGTVTLPRTGMPMSALLALGLTMVEAGAGLILLTDRRRANPILLPHVRRFIGRR
jgi:hypothetical protein